MSPAALNVGDWVQPVGLTPEQWLKVQNGKVGRVEKVHEAEGMPVRYLVSFVLTWMRVDGEPVAEPWLVVRAWIARENLERIAQPQPW